MLTGNIFDMQRDIGGISKDVRQIGSLILPSIRLKQMRVIGK
jgi:PmbA protein